VPPDPPALRRGRVVFRSGHPEPGERAAAAPEAPHTPGLEARV